LSKLTEKQKSVLAVANRNISEYPKYKTKNALGMMIHLFQDLTKYGIPIPEELQSIISEAFDKGWLKNNAPKPKGAKEQSVKMFMLCGKLYDQMCDRELSKKHGLTTKNKHVEYFAKKINRLPTTVFHMIDKYGDSFANVECDYFGYFKKKKPTTRKMKILEEWFISKKDRTWKAQIELMKRNPNSIKNKRK
tara:strand:- start:508 stop:1083 length:576 start_codon:yes stop_codon:yes gene_type:complete